MFAMGNAEKNQLIDRHAENKYYTDHYAVDINDKNDAKSFIVGYIDKDKTCLDVGCGAGLLGEALYNYKNTDVYGIELDKKALEYAYKTNSYKELYNFSITERIGKEYDRFIKAKIKFDYIVFADLLEHVIAPDDIIVFFSNFLKPDGKIIISLPNVAHFDIIEGLTKGDFNYNQVGLLDNTHLRFYTKRSFKQLIEQMNEVYNKSFIVKEIGKTIVDPGYTKVYPNLYGVLNKNGEACVLQYLYEISIDKKNKKKKEQKEKKADCPLKEIENLLCEKNKLEKRLGKTEKELADVYSSISWKITVPLRKGAAIFKKKR